MENGFSEYKKIRGINAASPTKTILVTFLLIILAGALLLSLPISVSRGRRTDFFTALFTSTSATCVTGLSLVDTLSHWSRFGHVVILALIQVGGLGFMAFATLFSLAVNRRISLRERLVIKQLLSADELSGAVSFTKRILLRTLIAETAGTIVLAIRFIPDFGFGEGLFMSVFHSVSAFCNAGIDLMGDMGGIGSMAGYAGDPIVCLVLIALMIYGGLGFLVWDDIRRKRVRDYSLHTKLVLVTTALLLVLGTAMFMLFEYNNRLTVGKMSFGEKLLACFFQSATCRSAGFRTFSQENMSVSSKILTILLMFVGGSPGSTAGGIKTVTLAILVVTGFCVMRGKVEISAFKRRISAQAVYKAIALFTVGVSLTGISALLVTMTNTVRTTDAIFECVAAFSTTGISMGAAADLNVLSQCVLMLLMYLGRVGLMTLSIALLCDSKPSKLAYPEGKTIIG